MIKLNLKTNNKSEELIKEYLQENVSEILADKINNGVKIQKDNKTLINKKDLSGFMKYANNEARKLAEKGATSTCIEDKTVFSWTIHYFEEDLVLGKLFNEDGSEFKPINKPTTQTIKSNYKKKENEQENLFDLINFDNARDTKSEKQENIKPTIDYETGEVLINNTNEILNKGAIAILYSLFGNALEVK